MEREAFMQCDNLDHVVQLFSSIIFFFFFFFFNTNHILLEAGISQR